MPASPAAMPTTTAIQIYCSGRTGTVPNSKIGARPKARRLTIVASRAAAMAGARTTPEKLRCSSSRANMTPAKGALKAAAKPALAPAVRRYRSSMRNRPRFRLMPWAVTAPIWIDGPSRPRDNPKPMPTMPPTSFTHKMRSQRRRITPKMTPLTWGMPLPPALGS